MKISWILAYRVSDLFVTVGTRDPSCYRVHCFSFIYSTQQDFHQALERF